MDDIAPAVRERLKDVIRRWGRILIPAFVDEYDNVIDGELLLELAAECGIRNVPRVILKGLSPHAKLDVKMMIDAYRRECQRQLTSEEKRQWITLELVRHPEYSDRRIADWIGCSPTTVGSVRATVQIGQSDSRLGQDEVYRSVAVVHTSTERQRKQAQQILQELKDSPANQHLTMRKLRHLRWAQRRAGKLAAAQPVTLKDFVIHVGDFRLVSRRIPDGSVDLAICDPPWAEWAELAIPMGQVLRRICKPNSVACVYTGVLVEDQWNDRLKRSLTKEWRVIAEHKRPGEVLFAGAVRHMYTSIIVYRSQPSGAWKTPQTLEDVIDSHIY